MAFKKVNLITKSNDGLLHALLYDNDEFFYALSSNINKRKDGSLYVHQVGAMDTCRESIINTLKKNLPSGKSSYKTKVLVTFPCEGVFNSDRRTTNDIKGFKSHIAQFERCVRNALRIINIIEKRLGWSLTRVMRCKVIPDKSAETTYSNIRNSKLDLEKDVLCYAPVYLFVGSSSYMLSPQTMSLYLLLLRLPVITDFYKDVRSFKALMATFEKHKNSGDYELEPEFVEDYKKWLPFLSNLRTLYKGRTRKKNFRAMAGDRKETDHLCGINGLCSEDYPYRDEQLGKRFTKLIKKTNS